MFPSLCIDFNETNMFMSTRNDAMTFMDGWLEEWMVGFYMDEL